MNWTQIKEKHPKAWGSLIFFIGMRYGMSPEIGGKSFLVLYGSSGEYRDNMPFPIRDLYDFFDEQGIFINTNAIEIKYGGCQDCYEVQGFGIEIVSKETHILFEEHTKEDKSIWCGVSPIHTTRTDAEIVAFTKAFEILEHKLNK